MRVTVVLRRLRLAMPMTCVLMLGALGCTPSAPPPSTSSAPASPTAPAPAPPTDAELTALLQRTLDHAKLAPFWHAELPGRRPVRLVKNEATRRATGLVLHGEPVQVLALADLEAQQLPYLDVHEVRASPARVTVVFRYPIEGVVGEVAFTKQGGAWVEAEIHVAER